MTSLVHSQLLWRWSVAQNMLQTRRQCCYRWTSLCKGLSTPRHCRMFPTVLSMMRRLTLLQTDHIERVEQNLPHSLIYPTGGMLQFEDSSRTAFSQRPCHHSLQNSTRSGQVTFQYTPKRTCPGIRDDSILCWKVTLIELDGPASFPEFGK